MQYAIVLSGCTRVLFVHLTEYTDYCTKHSSYNEGIVPASVQTSWTTNPLVLLLEGVKNHGTSTDLFGDYHRNNRANEVPFIVLIFC